MECNDCGRVDCAKARGKAVYEGDVLAMQVCALNRIASALERANDIAREAERAAEVRWQSGE